MVQQHVALLSGSLSDADAVQSLHGLLSVVLWGSRHSHWALCEQVATYFVQTALHSPHARRALRHGRRRVGRRRRQLRNLDGKLGLDVQLALGRR